MWGGGQKWRILFIDSKIGKCKKISRIFGTLFFTLRMVNLLLKRTKYLSSL